MLLLGLGGCALVDLVLILKKQRQPVDDVDVRIDGRRADGTPSPWESIHLHFQVKGEGLDASRVERAVSLSVEKYCSVQATLSGVATITHDFEII
jgi:putative redox protein